MKIIHHPYARDSLNKSAAKIYKENIYFEQVFYILMLCLLIKQRLASAYFNKLLRYNIHPKLAYDTLDSLLAVIMNAFFVHT